MVTTSKPTTDGLFFWNVTYPVVIFPSSVDLLIGGVPIPEICGVFVYVLLWFSLFCKYEHTIYETSMFLLFRAVLYENTRNQLISMFL